MSGSHICFKYEFDKWLILTYCTFNEKHKLSEMPKWLVPVILPESTPGFASVEPCSKPFQMSCQILDKTNSEEWKLLTDFDN